MILVSRDYEGLEIAAYELLEEAFEEEISARQSRALEGSISEDEVRESFKSKKTLSPGYYTRIHYLLELENMIELGIQFTPDTMLAHDLRGLEVLKKAQAKFDREYLPCPNCGKRMKKFSTWCWNCKKGPKEVMSRAGTNRDRRSA
jgi:hypothetical protein